ncbi:MAG: SUF system NifU family Fe-S cluster assembly protein, partial [Candidatus Gracilibacteria bacterium]
MDLYSQIILDHYKHPHNKGKIKNATVSAEETNTTCGDEVIFYLKFGKNKKVEEATFDGAGCAISQAACSMLTDKLIGMDIKKI